MAKYWYCYRNLGSDTPAARLVTTNYTKGNPFCGCSAGNKLCAIRATGTSASPNPTTLSTNIQAYINNAGSCTAQPVTGKKYVYCKP